MQLKDKKEVIKSRDTHKSESYLNYISAFSKHLKNNPQLGYRVHYMPTPRIVLNTLEIMF
jgi:hypothetical protein